VNVFVPVGGVPLTTPDTESIDNHDGFPTANAYVGVGVPLATNAYPYGWPTLAVNGGLVSGPNAGPWSAGTHAASDDDPVAAVVMPDGHGVGAVAP